VVKHAQSGTVIQLDDIIFIVLRILDDGPKFRNPAILNNFNQDFLQATSVSVEDSVGLQTILAVYLPPRHTAKQEQFEEFDNTPECRFTAGGDYNAKHTD
jgi:hypothetical protein